MSVINLSGLSADLKRAKTEVDEAVRNALVEGARAAQDHAIANKSFGGNKLRHSVLYRFKTKTRVTVYSKVKVAKFINDGTSPHRIYARRAKALCFFQGDRLRFAKSVNHPGNEATNFFDDAVEAGREKAAEVLAEELARISI